MIVSLQSASRCNFGFNNTFNYKGFDLSVFLYARLGQWIAYDYNTTYRINALEMVEM